VIYLALFATTLVYVFLRAFQQKNVMHSKYLWMVPVSYGMGFCDVYIITSIAHGGHVLWIVALAMGTGGTIGSISATYLHNRWTT
jgi:hypothetical protein